MPKDSSKGAFDSFLDSLALNAAVQLSRNAKGKPDPYAAAGIAHGMKGGMSDWEMAQLGAMLGAQGAFDDDPDDDDDLDDFDDFNDFDDDGDAF